MLRKILIYAVLIPLAIIIVALAVANRQATTLSLDPFRPEHPALSFTVPLFALLLALTIVGVLIGGFAAWLRQAKYRRQARQRELEIRDLRREIEILNVRIESATRNPGEESAARISFHPSA